jgi:preprotein translocase subunit SecD
MRLAAAVLGAALLVGGSACGEESASPDEPEQLTRVVLAPSVKASAEGLEVAVETIRERLDSLGVRGASVKRQGGTIEVIVPGTADRELPVARRRGLLELYDLQGDLAKASLDEQGNPRPSVKRLEERPGTVLVTCGPPTRYCPGVNEPPRTTYYYLFEDGPEMTGDDIERKGTRQDFEPTVGEPVVLMTFTPAGAKKFEEITLRLAERGRVRADSLGVTDAMENDVANQQFAIVLDREIKSAPTIDFDDNPSGISGKNGAIITGVTLQEAKDLALVLRSGALPIEFRIVSIETRHRDE